MNKCPAILESVRRGNDTTKLIIADTGYSSTFIRKRLKILVESGFVIRYIPIGCRMTDIHYKVSD